MILAAFPTSVCFHICVFMPEGRIFFGFLRFTYEAESSLLHENLSFSKLSALVLSETEIGVDFSWERCADFHNSKMLIVTSSNGAFIAQIC